MLFFFEMYALIEFKIYLSTYIQCTGILLGNILINKSDQINDQSLNKNLIFQTNEKSIMIPKPNLLTDLIATKEDLYI